LLLACHSRLSLDFFDSGLHTCTAVARLTLALAKLSCFKYGVETGIHPFAISKDTLEEG